MENTIVENSRAALKEEGYYTDNLWHINDVKSRFKCTDQQAMDILDKVLQSEYVISTIFELIHNTASDMDIEYED